jgi:hypothetical protein
MQVLSLLRLPSADLSIRTNSKQRASREVDKAPAVDFDNIRDIAFKSRLRCVAESRPAHSSIFGLNISMRRTLISWEPGVWLSVFALKDATNLLHD